MGVVIKQSIKNSIFTYLGFALGAFNIMILMPAVMEKEQMGLVQSIISWTNIFTAFFTLGMPLALVKFYNQYKAKGQETKLLFYTLAFPILIFTVFAILYSLFKHQFIQLIAKDDSDLMFKYFGLVFLMTYSSLIFETLTALLKNYFITEPSVFLKELFMRVLNTATLLCCYFKLIDFNTLVYLYAGILTSLAFFLAIYTIKKIPITYRIKGNFTGKKEILQYGTYTILNVGITYLIFQLDTVMIQKYLGLAPLAIYAIAINISVLVQLPQRSLLPAMHGVIAKSFFNDNMTELETIYKKSSLVMVISGGFMISLLILGLPPILTYILPSQYQEGLISIYTILCFAKYIDMLFGFNGYIILQSPFFRFEVWSGLTLLIISILLNILFIEPYGMTGAAIATVLSFLVYNIMRLIYIWKKLNMHPFSSSTWKGLLITFIPLLLLLSFPSHSIELGIIKSIVYCIITVGAILFFKPSEDIDIILNKIRKNISIK